MAEYPDGRYDEYAGLDLTGLDLVDVLADDEAVELLRAHGPAPKGDPPLVALAALSVAVDGDLPTDTPPRHRAAPADTGVTRMTVRVLAAVVAALVLVSGTGIAAAGSASFNPFRELFEWGRSIGERTVSPSAALDRREPEPPAVAPHRVLKGDAPPAQVVEPPAQVLAAPAPEKHTAVERSRREVPAETAAATEPQAPAEPAEPAEPEAPAEPAAIRDAPPSERRDKAHGHGTKDEHRAKPTGPPAAEGESADAEDDGAQDEAVTLGAEPVAPEPDEEQTTQEAVPVEPLVLPEPGDNINPGAAPGQESATTPTRSRESKTRRSHRVDSIPP